MVEPCPELLSELQGLQDALGKADDPRGHWLQLLERCKAAELRYPDAADSIAYMARSAPQGNRGPEAVGR